MMPAGHFYAEAARQACEGQLAAQRALYAIQQGTADPDALHAALAAVHLSGEPERVRAFVRTIQKTIEGARHA